MDANGLLFISFILLLNKDFSILHDILICPLDLEYLNKEEVDKILGSMGMSRIDIENELEEGTQIKVLKGAFANMFGKVNKIDMAKQCIEVALDLFGQETIVEVGFDEVEKV